MTEKLELSSLLEILTSRIVQLDRVPCVEKKIRQQGSEFDI